MSTVRSGSAGGKGVSTSRSTACKMAALAARPTARVVATVSVSSGRFSSERHAYLTSIINIRIEKSPGPEVSVDLRSSYERVRGDRDRLADRYAQTGVRVPARPARPSPHPAPG